MDRYIGLGAHSSSCTVARIGPSGKRLHSQAVKTNAKALIQVISASEEGPHSNSMPSALNGVVARCLADCGGSRTHRFPRLDR